MTDAIIEQAARVMDDYGNGHDGLNECGQREQLARALADAGLLRQEPPTRDEIARQVALAMDRAWNDATEYADLPTEAADALLALWEGRKR